MAGQINQCLDNLEAVLTEADMTFANLVWIQSFTTDMDLFFEHAHELARLSVASRQPVLHKLAGLGEVSGSTC